MTLKIDFDNKTVEVDDSTGLSEIADTLTNLGLKWREFSVKPAGGTKIVIVEKQTIPQYVPSPTYPTITPTVPWYAPGTIIC